MPLPSLCPCRKRWYSGNDCLNKKAPGESRGPFPILYSSPNPCRFAKRRAPDAAAGQWRIPARRQFWRPRTHSAGNRSGAAFAAPLFAVFVFLPPVRLAVRASRGGLCSADRGLPYRNFCIPSVAAETSALMVTVNLMPLRSPKASSQFKNASVSPLMPWPTVLSRLSINTWEMS